MNVPELLAKRINMPEIKRVALWATGSRENIATLWILALSECRMTSVNALWTMTHLPATDAECLESMRNEMIDMLLSESDKARNACFSSSREIRNMMQTIYAQISSTSACLRSIPNVSHTLSDASASMRHIGFVSISRN